EQLRIRGELFEACRIALLDTPEDRRFFGYSESSPGNIGSAPGARELDQRQRIALAFYDNSFANGCIHRAVQMLEQQRVRIAVAQSADGQLRDIFQRVIADLPASGAHDRDALRQDATCDERDDLLGFLIDPLRVVDDTAERFFLSYLCEQGQCRQSH